MSDRFRDGTFAPWIAAAIGLAFVATTAWLLFFSKGYQAANEQHQAQYADYATYDQERERCLRFPTVNEIRECFSTTERTYREQDRAEQDLNAQREMADWAEGMLWSSILGVLVTAIGVVFVAFTLQEARVTTRAALRAADEAGKTNDITKRAFVSDQRPWVNVNVQIVSDITFDEVGMHFKAKLSANNAGKTPATSVFIVPIIDVEEPERFKDLTTKMMVHWTDSHNLRLLNHLTWGSQIGDAIFPNEPRMRTQPVEMKREKFAAFSAPGSKIMPAILIACTYGPKEGSGYYVTAKMFHINGAGDPRRVNPIVIPESGTIPQSEVSISHVFSGSFVT